MEGYLPLLFSEPSGPKIGLTFLGLSLVSLFGWVFFAVLHDGGHILLFLGIAFALSGSAESLSTDRRRLAGSLRVAAVSVLLGFLGLTLLAPEIVLG